MTQPLSSWNGNLPSNVMLDSGVLYVASSIFAAQEGGLQYDPGETRRQVPFDGQRSGIVGLDRTVEFKPTISGTVLEMSDALLTQFDTGATHATVSGGPSGATQVQPKAAGTLYAAGDYLTNVRAIWQLGGGGFFQLRFMKAIVMKWGPIVGKDKEEAKIALVIEARLDMSISGQLTSNPPVVGEFFTSQPA